MNLPRWDAPRAAYLLTAVIADKTPHAGAMATGDAIGAEWTGYDQRAQQDILTALGAQTRLALRMLHDKLGMQIEMEWDCTGPITCAEALAAARELICPASSVPGAPRVRAAPQCAHCREIIAKAMCGLQIQAYSRLGFTPAMIAATCRQTARKAATSARR